MPEGTGRYEGIACDLCYRFWSAEDPHWVIIFAHGFGDHSGRYEPFGSRIVGYGGALFVPDLRGHGLSGGERLLIDDVDLAASELLSVSKVGEFPDVPIVVAGHSYGGLVAARGAALKQVSVAALVASGARIGGWPAGAELVGAIDRGEFDPETDGRGNPILDPTVDFPRSVLSRDESVFDAFANDPLSQRGAYPLPSLRAYVTATRRLEELTAVFDFPVLYLHGGADPIADFRLSAQRILQLAADDVEIRVFAETRHSIYNEINRDEVFAVLQNFIERAVSSHRQPVVPAIAESAG